MKIFNLYRSYSLLFVAIVTLFVSCKSDKPEEEIKPTIDLNSHRGMYIINEGNFQFGNASISYYNPDDETVIEDLYKQVNQHHLGDVCQSMTLINGWYYVIVNNSQKIEIVNPESFERKSSITGLVSPRYMIPVSSSKAYVSDFKSHRVSIINLGNHTKQGEIAIHGWTEEMHVMYGKAYITNMKNDKLYIVNTATDRLEDSLVLAQSPGSLVEDKYGKLWVLCQGDATMNKTGALCCINPQTNSIEKRMDFPLNNAPMRLCINDTHDTLYYINKHIYQLPVDAQTLPSTPLISGNDKNFYGMSIEPKTGRIFAADAIDYIQKGKIYCYNSKGVSVKDFKVGLIPSRIYFK
jgi:DNA-binding beta-propeller fold protein YncE